MTLRGIESTKKWLEKNDLSMSAWCRDNSLDPSEMSKVLSGKRQRISVETAWKIQKATHGVVEWWEWIPGR